MLGCLQRCAVTGLSVLLVTGCFILCHSKSILLAKYTITKQTVVPLRDSRENVGWDCRCGRCSILVFGAAAIGRYSLLLLECCCRRLCSTLHDYGTLAFDRTMWMTKGSGFRFPPEPSQPFCFSQPPKLSRQPNIPSKNQARLSKTCNHG